MNGRPQSGRFAPGGRARACAYRTLWICARTFERAARICAYAAAGLLGRDDLRTASRLLWREYGTALQDVDGGLDAWERRLYDAVLRPGDRVLLAGCGAGRDLLALAELGYEVTGLEPTPELADLARRHAARRRIAATVHLGFVESTPLDADYDVIVLAGNCYSFIPAAGERLAALARLQQHLRPNGRIVVTYTGAMRRPPLAIHVARLIARLARSGWLPERGGRFAPDYLTPGLVRYERMFQGEEVARECAQAGLDVILDGRTAAYYVVATARVSATTASQTAARLENLRG